MIYVDNAATSFPKPQQVISAVATAMRDYGANPGRSGHFVSQRAAREVYDTREAVAQHFNATGPEKVSFTLNTTYALNMVIKGLLRPGDHVIISSLEHNAVFRPVTAMREHGIGHSIANVFFDSDEKTIEEFSRKITQRTKAIICTLASNVCGYVLPFQKIGALCKEKGLIFIADGAQAAGYLPINVQRDHIDFLCIPAHKGLYGPMGVGAIIINSDKPLKTILEGGAGMASREPEMPLEYPERLEAGTLNLPGIAGFRAGLQFIKSHTELVEGEKSLWRYFIMGLRNIPKVQLQEIIPTASYVPLLSFNIEGKSCSEVETFLSEKNICVRGGLHCAPLAHEALKTPMGSIRVSFGGFNTKMQADQILYIISKIS